ncbi:MAG: FAD-dependent oxidoreductase, partial [Burkholderiales bacterium]
VLRVVLAAGETTEARVKLVQGSHIVVARLHRGDHAYILQNDDGRVVFACPYQNEYTLIGTTDLELSGEPRGCAVTTHEIDYLCGVVNRYFVRQIARGDVKWSYCGVRALLDDGASDPARVSRDYRLRLHGDGEAAPLLSVFGGKITTYRRLAERALAKLAPYFPHMGQPWTAGAPLAGGDLPGGSVEAHIASLSKRYPRLPQSLVRTLAMRHGTRTGDVLEGSDTLSDLGEPFGAQLYAREVDYFVSREWAREGDDVLWRRTKAGLHLSPEERLRVAAYVREAASHA